MNPNNEQDALIEAKAPVDCGHGGARSRGSEEVGTRAVVAKGVEDSPPDAYRVDFPAPNLADRVGEVAAPSLTLGQQVDSLHGQVGICVAIFAMEQHSAERARWVVLTKVDRKGMAVVGSVAGCGFEGMMTSMVRGSVVKNIDRNDDESEPHSSNLQVRIVVKRDVGEGVPYWTTLATEVGSHVREWEDGQRPWGPMGYARGDAEPHQESQEVEDLLERDLEMSAQLRLVAAKRFRWEVLVNQS